MQNASVLTLAFFGSSRRTVREIARKARNASLSTGAAPRTVPAAPTLPHHPAWPRHARARAMGAHVAGAALISVQRIAARGPSQPPAAKCVPPRAAPPTPSASISIHHTTSTSFEAGSLKPEFVHSGHQQRLKNSAFNTPCCSCATAATAGTSTDRTAALHSARPR